MLRISVIALAAALVPFAGSMAVATVKIPATTTSSNASAARSAAGQPRMTNTISKYLRSTADTLKPGSIIKVPTGGGGGGGDTYVDLSNYVTIGEFNSFSDYIWSLINNIEGGVVGPQGNQGAPGSIGPQGVPGSGAAGSQGPQGSIGPIGPQGNQGLAGLSAYHEDCSGPMPDPYYCDVTAPEGAFQRWLKKFIGATGVQGSVGATGPQGIPGSGAPGSQGVQGNPGATGPQGLTGPQGVAGFSAYEQDCFGPSPDPTYCSSGFNGWLLKFRGDTGSQGATGTQGSVGVTGSQGVVGAQGTQGVQGTTGLQGPQGNQGSTGLSAYKEDCSGPSADPYYCDVTAPEGGFQRWLKKFIGATGTQGVQGDPGMRGSLGYQGNQGVIGATGTQGVQGADGGRGVQGYQGGQGIPGVCTGSCEGGGTGLQGATGAQGATGSTGPAGAQGTQGVQGTTGSQGPQGNNGTQGNQGVTGFSAYEQDCFGSSPDPIYCASGFQGWLLKFTGSTGAQGTQGDQGGIGPQGLKGDQGVCEGSCDGGSGVQGNQGDIGPQGPQGNQGATGPSGTLDTTITTALATNSNESLGGSVQLNKISKTGYATDLIPGPSDVTFNDGDVLTYDNISGKLVWKAPTNPNDAAIKIAYGASATAAGTFATVDQAIDTTLTLHTIASTGDATDLVASSDATSGKVLTSNGPGNAITWEDPYVHPAHPGGKYGYFYNNSPAFGSTFQVPYITVDTEGHVGTVGGGVTNNPTTVTVTIPNNKANIYNTPYNEALGLVSLLQAQDTVATNKIRSDTVATGTPFQETIENSTRNFPLRVSNATGAQGVAFVNLPVANSNTSETANDTNAGYGVVRLGAPKVVSTLNLAVSHNNPKVFPVQLNHKDQMMVSVGTSCNSCAFITPSGFEAGSCNLSGDMAVVTFYEGALISRGSATDTYAGKISLSNHPLTPTSNNRVRVGDLPVACTAVVQDTSGGCVISAYVTGSTVSSYFGPTPTRPSSPTLANGNIYLRGQGPGGSCHYSSVTCIVPVVCDNLP